MTRKLIPFLFLSLCFFSSRSQILRVATFNMRYDNSGDSLNPWKERLPVISQMVHFHDFDVFGGQELLHHQVEGLQNNLPQFAFYGVGRDDGKTKGEYTPVFYKKDKFRLLEKGTFWLSETPGKVSKGWDAALPRICSWIKLEEVDTGLTFFVFNTHFDHRGMQARKNSAILILDQMKTIAGNVPALLTGDFNFDQYHENYKLIKLSPDVKDTYDLAKIKMPHNGTFNGFRITSNSDKRIDHIFVNDSFEVRKYGILTDSYFGKFPSDHFPVVVEVAAKKTKGKTKK